MNTQKKVAIIQSNYIPWRGYFGLIASADEFILYDDMQFTRRDWRNRNKIKTRESLCWLTIPVNVKGKYYQKICETRVVNQAWRKQHWQSLVLNYKKAPYFKEISELLEPLYLSQQCQLLSEINFNFIKIICDYLNITTTLKTSMDFHLCDGKSERLLDLCKQVNANIYLSGPSAKGYLDEGLFEKNDVQVAWADYSYLTPYPQLWGTFEPHVTILDLLFNCGPSAKSYYEIQFKFHERKSI